MAICELNKDLLKSTLCGYSLGAISRIYLANYEDVKATTLSSTNGCTEVASITMDTDKVWYKIDPAKNSASWTDELVVNDDGSKYRTHTLNFNVIGAFDCSMPDVIDALSLGKYIAVIQKNDGTYAMLGRTAGLEADVVTAGGSDDNGTVNGVQVTLSANTAECAIPLSTTAIEVVTGD